MSKPFGPGVVLAFYVGTGGQKMDTHVTYGEVIRVNRVTLTVRSLHDGSTVRVSRSAYYSQTEDRDEWGGLPFAPAVDPAPYRSEA